MNRAILIGFAANGLLLAGCSQPAEEIGSAAQFLLSGSDKQLVACRGGFDDAGRGQFDDSLGGKWVWLPRPDGTISHYCRKLPSAEISAWAEASGGEAATHKLTFNAGQQLAVFQQLPSR
jgi:hypothetical protein